LYCGEGGGKEKRGLVLSELSRSDSCKRERGGEEKKKEKSDFSSFTFAIVEGGRRSPFSLGSLYKEGRGGRGVYLV